MGTNKQKGNSKPKEKEQVTPKMRIGYVGEYKPIPKFPNKCTNC